MKASEHKVGEVSRNRGWKRLRLVLLLSGGLALAAPEASSTPSDGAVQPTILPPPSDSSAPASEAQVLHHLERRERIDANELHAQTKARIIYDTSAERKFFEKTQNRKPLSPSDEKAIREMLIRYLPEDAAGGTIHQSPNIRIDYISTFNMLLVEIAIPDTDKAKEESVQWLKGQGLSQEFICNYPIDFNLNANIGDKFWRSNKIFSSSVPGCQ